MKRRNDRKFSPWLGIALAALVTACVVPEDAAKRRVTAILSGIQAEGGSSGGAIHAAMLQWDDGQHKSESIGMEAVLDRFTEWCREKDLDRKISGWEITGADKDGAAVIVSVKVEGRLLRMRVEAGRRILWVD